MHKDILRYLQIPPESRAAREALDLLDEAQNLLRVATWQRGLETTEFHRLFHPHAAASQSLGRLLNGCTQVVLMIATVGEQLERRAKTYLAQHETFRGYVLDRLGSYLVEQQMRLLDRRVTRHASTNGVAATRRYSPGYQDFSLEAQRVFVELAAGEVPGLLLSPSGLLRPEKTITAVKGLLEKKRGFEQT